MLFYLLCYEDVMRFYFFIAYSGESLFRFDRIQRSLRWSEIQWIFLDFIIGNQPNRSGSGRPIVAKQMRDCLWSYGSCDVCCVGHWASFGRRRSGLCARSILDELCPLMFMGCFRGCGLLLFSLCPIISFWKRIRKFFSPIFPSNNWLVWFGIFFRTFGRQLSILWILWISLLVSLLGQFPSFLPRPFRSLVYTKLVCLGIFSSKRWPMMTVQSVRWDMQFLGKEVHFPDTIFCENICPFWERCCGWTPEWPDQK